MISTNKAKVILKTTALLLIFIVSTEAKFFQTNPKGSRWKECDQIIQGDYSKDTLHSLAPRRRITITRLRECSELTNALKDNEWVSEEERRFPIAYAIAAYQNPYQLINLLRLIYRPHNLYCIHIDGKTPQYMETRMQHVLKCLPSNVFQIPKAERVNVTWGQYSVLEAFLLCAKALYENQQVNWTFLLNVNEKELPLRTNWELVKVFRALNGSNLVHGVKQKVHERIPLTKMPFDVKWIKGTFLVGLQRPFVQYLLTDYRPRAILEAMKSESQMTKIPDEMLFATLIYNPHLGAPGACDLVVNYSRSDPTTWVLSRYVIWDAKRCATRHLRNEVCMLGRADLPTLFTTPHLFANKFLTCVQPEAYQCLSYWILRKMEGERVTGHTDPSFDPSLFGNIYCSQMHQ